MALANPTANMSRHFLGWDAPLLPRAARWLIEHFTHFEKQTSSAVEGLADLTVVVPGARVGRRLTELLVETSSMHSGGDGEAANGADAAGIIPPRIVTVGRLPELLYDSRQVAQPLAALLSRAWSLKQADASVVGALTAWPPQAEDWLGWVGLAQELAGLSELLGAEALSPADVAGKIERGELGPQVDLARWQALGELERAYQAALADQGLVDQHAARAAALANPPGELSSQPGEGGLTSALVFIGVAEMPGVTRGLIHAALGQANDLSNAAEPGLARVHAHALIHAPQSESASFSPLGELLTDAWAQRQVDLKAQSIRVADRPRDQAQMVVEVLGQASPSSELSPADCVVGVGDADSDGLVGSVRRTLDLAGVPVRPAAGLADDAVNRSRPGRLLEAVGAYLKTRRFDDLAALLRHPDIGVDHQAAEGWLTLLDRYLTQHVQGRVTGDWLGVGQGPGSGGLSPESTEDSAGNQVRRSESQGPSPGSNGQGPKSAERSADSGDAEPARGEVAPVAGVERLKRVYERIERWLPQAADRVAALPTWTGQLARMLEEVYQPLIEAGEGAGGGGSEASRGGKGGDRGAEHEQRPAEEQNTREANRPLLAALEQIGQTLGELAALDDQGPTTPRVTADQAISLLDRLLAQRLVPPQADHAAVEVLGYLELVLDDSPLPVLVGVNEGSIPSSLTAHPLLPDTLRSKLGLADNRRRLARDVYALTVITRSRPNTVLISGQRSADGDPLAPSRLLLACEPEELVRRVNAFYNDEHPNEQTAGRARPVLNPGITEGPTKLHVPRPTRAKGEGEVSNSTTTDAATADAATAIAADANAATRPPSTPTAGGGAHAGQSQPPAVLDSLHVTAFRDYLACPYRFYLKHVEGLEPMDDRAVEMDGALFGNVAHAVLRDFGRSELAASTDDHEIVGLLEDRLDREVKRRFGPRPVAAIQLQAQQLSERLAQFAKAQAAWTLNGWRILPDQLERRYEAQLDVDGQPFTITGQIDRIDHHQEYGYRIIDYKIADTAETPENKHRKDQGTQWIDLQLPLYRELARGAGFEGEIDLGYVVLPRDTQQVGWQAAAWAEEEIDDALEHARDVVRQIRQNKFWPPAERPPTFDDGLKAICQDRVDQPAESTITI